MSVPTPSEVIANRYQVIQILRQSPGRVTLLAEDQTTQTQVVIKLLSFTHVSSWQDVTFFEREVAILRHLHHPGIPRYLDAFDLPQHQQKGLVQAYIPAPSLHQRQRQGQRFSEAELKGIAHQILAILTYLHEQHPPVIHRDLKPSNILLDDTGKVYVVDFGAVQAKVLGEGTMTLAIPGTSGYIAPEQFRGRAVPASDLYSLGASLVALASGRDPNSLPEKELRLVFEPYVALSPGMIRWLHKLLDPRLEYRFGSARAAQVALENLEENPAHALATVILPATPPTRIQVRHWENGKEIVFPVQKWTGATIFLGLFSLTWMSFIAFWTGSALLLAPGLLKVIFALFSLPFWGAGWVMVTQVFLPSVGRYRLQLSPDHINLVQDLWGFRIHRPGPRHQLTQVELRPSAQQSVMAMLSGTELIYHLKICGEEQTYVLGSLRESEARWCGNYLSQELGIPLRTYDAGEAFSSPHQFRR